MSAISQIKPRYTAIALVVDRSGSMSNLAEDTKGGIKQFIADQKQNPDKATLTLAQFDHEYEILNDCADLKTVDENAFAEQYRPRGCTALLDAIGKTILKMDQDIAKMNLSEKPDRVIVAIVTDGEENASLEFKTVDKIKTLIEAKQKCGWDFIYLGADINGFNEAKGYGLDAGKIVHFDSSQVREAMKSIGDKVMAARQGNSTVFSDDERAKLVAVRV